MKISLLILLFSSIVYAKDITVMSIDTGVDLSHQLLKDHAINVNDDDYRDYNSHGTHVAGVILKNTCSQVKFISCRYYHEFWEIPSKNSLTCFKKAIDLKVDYINFSSGGENPNEIEKLLIKTLIENGTKVVVAAGNENQFQGNYYPAKYDVKDLIVVGNLKLKGVKHKLSNWGYKNMVWEIGTKVKSTLPNGQFGIKSGTSMAAAIRTNKLLRQECRKLK